jgi:hypothetical protein
MKKGTDAGPFFISAIRPAKSAVCSNGVQPYVNFGT